MNPHPQPNLAAVVAMSTNRVIGRDGTLPWHLPEDLRWFKRLTTGGTVLMGRKTFESIGRPLPKRRNLVLTRSPGFHAEGVEIYNSVDSLLEHIDAREDTFVIGGAEVYRALLPSCSKVFLSLVEGEIEGDTYLDPFEADFPACEELFRYPAFAIFVYSRANG